MLRCCLSVVCLLHAWYRFETVQHSGPKLYRIVGLDRAWLITVPTASKKTELFLNTGGYISAGTPVSRRPS